MTLIQGVIDAHREDDQMVYIHVTRGVAKRAHAFPKELLTPTVLIMSNPLVLPDMRVDGRPALVALRDQIDFAARQCAGGAERGRARRSGGDPVPRWLADRGFVIECLDRQERLMVPPKDNLILEGIRYRLIEELCAAGGIPFEAHRIAREEVFSADEVLLSSATKEVLAGVSIDGKTIGNG